MSDGAPPGLTILNCYATRELKFVTLAAVRELSIR